MNKSTVKKPYSESCDQNKQAILTVISPVLQETCSVLEVGSGTGQHAIYFAENMPHLQWQTSDCKPYLEGINLWLTEASQKNILPPIELDVSKSQWSQALVDAVFTANSIHIMDKKDVVNFIHGVAKLLSDQGQLLIYGPFNYKGSYTSASNESFDHWLKSRDPLSGIKNFEDMVALANDSSLQLVSDYEMPANNRILHFVKKT